MLRVALLVAVLGLAPAGAAAEDTYVQDFERGTLAGDGFVEALATRPGDVWQSRVEDGAYVLENRSAANAVRYYDFNRISGGEPALQTAASVTVEGEFAGENAGAGILARYDPDTGRYYAFVRTAHGVALYKRGARGLERLVNLDGPVRGEGGPARLTVRRAGDGVELFVNGRSIGRLSSGDVTGERFGLVAIDRGRFRFDDFSVTTR
jgi:hypothetical protein